MYGNLQQQFMDESTICNIGHMLSAGSRPGNVDLHHSVSSIMLELLQGDADLPHIITS